MEVINEGKSTAFLPFELITDILKRLPVKSLMCFKCVSKSWYDLINSKIFINLHLDQSLKANSYTTLVLDNVKKEINIYSFNHHHSSYHVNELCYPKDLKRPRYHTIIIGSCNGLICLSSYGNGILSLYNPATRAYKRLPDERNFTTEANISYSVYSCAFGYDRVSDDYKVIKLCYYIWDKIEDKTMLYSLKTNAWEIIPNPPWDTKYLNASSVLCNNSLHWLIDNSEEIKCFNLATQEYYEIPLLKRISSYSPKLTTLRGQLCVVTNYLDIWILQEYGVEKSWTRLFHQRSRSVCTFYSTVTWDRYSILACLEDGHNILAAESDGRVNPIMICCDVQYEEAKITQMVKQGLPSYNVNYTFGVQHWVESLVPLTS